MPEAVLVHDRFEAAYRPRRVRHGMADSDKDVRPDVLRKAEHGLHGDLRPACHSADSETDRKRGQRNIAGGSARVEPRDDFDSARPDERLGALQVTAHRDEGRGVGNEARASLSNRANEAKIVDDDQMTDVGSDSLSAPRCVDEPIEHSPIDRVGREGTMHPASSHRLEEIDRLAFPNRRRSRHAGPGS